MKVPFTYRSGGRTQSGTYEVLSKRPKIIEVTTEYGTKKTQLSKTPPLTLARIIASELAHV